MQRSLYDRSIVVDATAPISPFALIGTANGPDELVRAYVSAGITFVIFTIVDDYPNSIEQTLKLLGQNRAYFLGHSDQFALVDSVEEVQRAKVQGRVAVAFAFQGTNALLGEITLVEIYRRLGVVQMLLAYNSANFVADGCHEDRNAGVTEFGRRLIREMNRVGMMVDVAHVGLRSSLEALALTTRPPIFSHATPRRFAPHARNVTDEQIRACACKDGVVCLSGVGLFMDGKHQQASVSKLADTIEYVCQLVGARHAGLGLDYCVDPDSMLRYVESNPGLYGGGLQYSTKRPFDFIAPAFLPELANELTRRRYTDEEVQGILGNNYLRALAANS